MKNSIRVIRISAFSILFLMLAEVVIVECVDIMSIRSILAKIMYIVWFLLAVILIKIPKLAAKQITMIDLLNIVIFVGLITYLGQMLSTTTAIQTAFQGNNGYVNSYGEGDGSNGYGSIESALEDEIKYGKKTGNYNELEEIYRIQAGENIFVYFKEGEEQIVEFDLFKQSDFYYISGIKVLLYDGIASDDRYTTEETIRKDIANTMWRGVGYKEAGVPAWGVSIDERIFSMTINSGKADDIILINEKDGKKYYFWIITDVGEIKTIDDVKTAKIEMNSP